jgi:hypothetical protein
MPIGTTNQKIPGCGSHHIAVQTRDWKASLRFYRDVLGMPYRRAAGRCESRCVTGCGRRQLYRDLRPDARYQLRASHDRASDAFIL